MKCPKCPGRLTSLKIGNVAVDRCYMCEGLWFDPNELEEVLDHYAKDLEALHLDSHKFDGKELEEHYKYFDIKKGLCPVCNDGETFMDKKCMGSANINVDFCPKGHGIWLDGGEIQLIRDRKHLNTESYNSLIKYMFSLEGFKNMFRKKPSKEEK